jgi:hypothetical protein
METIERAKAASAEIVNEYAPAEDLSFDGVWADALATPDADLRRAIEIEGGSRLVLGGAELPLLSAIIAPVAIWLAKRVAEKAVDPVIEKTLGAVKRLLSKNRDSTAGQLTDADIDRIAQRLVDRIVLPRA